jgi:hemerythrin
MYPNTVAHVAEHQRLVHDVMNFTHDLNNGKAMISMETTKYLRHWLLTHIIHNDKDLGHTLSESGVN